MPYSSSIRTSRASSNARPQHRIINLSYLFLFFFFFFLTGQIPFYYGALLRDSTARHCFRLQKRQEVAVNTHSAHRSRLIGNCNKTANPPSTRLRARAPALLHTVFRFYSFLASHSHLVSSPPPRRTAHQLSRRDTGFTSHHSQLRCVLPTTAVFDVATHSLSYTYICAVIANGNHGVACIRRPCSGSKAAITGSGKGQV